MPIPLLTALSGLNAVLAIGTLALLVWFGIWVNRRLKLGFRSVNWIAIYLVLSIGLGPVYLWLVGQVINGNQFLLNWTGPTFVGVWGHATRLIRNASYLIAGLMFIAELVPLLAQSFSTGDPQDAFPLSRVRANLTLFGWVLIVLALLPILLLLGMLWLI